MILGKSIDKAQIKKIPIRVWSLTDEINATLKVLNDEYQNKIPEDKIVLLKAFYEATPIAELNKKPKLTIIDGGKTLPSPVAPVAVTQAAPIDPFEAAMLAEVEAQKATATPPVAVVEAAPIDPFEAAMLAEVEAQKAAQNQEVKSNAADQAVLQQVQEVVNNINTEIPRPLAAVPTPAVPEPVLVPKTYTIQDFLNLRKDGIRIYPDTNQISNGQCIIYDINFDQMLFFTEKAFKPGQEIIIEFNIHKTFTVTAKIISITNIGVGSRIISPQPLNYRINAILTHEHLGDRTLIRNFLSKVDPLLNTNIS